MRFDQRVFKLLKLNQTFLNSSEESESESSTVPRDERDFLTNPYWIEDVELKKGEVDFLSSAEVQFWKDLIDKYLYPIDQDKEEEVMCFNCNVVLELIYVFYFRHVLHMI